MTPRPDSTLALVLAALDTVPVHVRRLQYRTRKLHPRRLSEHLHTLHLYGLAERNGDYWCRAGEAAQAVAS